MTAKYQIYGEQVKKNMDAITRGEPVELEVLDTEAKGWIRAKVLVSRQPLEGSEEVALLGMFGGVDERSGWRIKIIEEFPDLIAEE